MKKITQFLLFIGLSHLANAQRLQVAGTLETDTLSIQVVRFRGTNSPQLIKGNGSLVSSLNNNLAISNGALVLNATGTSKDLVKTNSGTQFRLIENGTADSLAIPYASATAEGLMNTSKQSIAGTKIFNNGLHLAPGNGLNFLGANGTNWTISRGSNTHFLVNSIGGTNRLTVNSTGGMNIPGTLAVDGTVESAIGFKHPQNNTSILRANGSLASYSLSDGLVCLNNTATTYKGIGVKTTTPEALFHINGSGYYSNEVFRVSSDSSAAVAINSTNQGWTGITISRLNDEKWFIGMAGISNSIPEPRPKASTNLFFNGAGNIGIGTDTPSDKLQVNGSVKANSLKINGGNGEQLISANGGSLSAGYGVIIRNNTINTIIPRQNVTTVTTANSTFTLNSTHDVVFFKALNISVSVPAATSALRGKRWVLQNTVPNGIMTITFPTNAYVNDSGTSSSVYYLDSGKLVVFFCKGTKYYREMEQ